MVHLCFTLWTINGTHTLTRPIDDEFHENLFYFSEFSIDRTTLIDTFNRIHRLIPNSDRQSACMSHPCYCCRCTASISSLSIVRRCDWRCKWYYALCIADRIAFQGLRTIVLMDAEESISGSCEMCLLFVTWTWFHFPKFDAMECANIRFKREYRTTHASTRRRMNEANETVSHIQRNQYIFKLNLRCRLKMRRHRGSTAQY